MTNKPPYPSTAEDFRRQYSSHSREELLHAVADLHVLQIEQMKRNATLATDFEATVEHMNEGCICGRAPAPKHPVDPRLSKPAPKAKSEPETAELIPIVGRKDSGLTLHRIRRDAQGRITTAEVVNGLWTLKADHAKGEFWPAERPENRNRIDQYTGWTK